MGRTKLKKIKFNNSIMLYVFLLMIIIFLSTIIFLQNNVKNTINSSDESLVLYSDTENITIDNSLPISDKFGKNIHDSLNNSYKYLKFDIVNVSSSSKKYQLYIKKNKLNTNEINNKYVKIYLTNQNDLPLGIFTKNKVPSYVDLKYINDLPSSKILYSDIIDKYQKKSFHIKVWVTDNYVSSNENYFSFDIGVRTV